MSSISIPCRTRLHTLASLYGSPELSFGSRRALSTSLLRTSASTSGRPSAAAVTPACTVPPIFGPSRQSFKRRLRPTEPARLCRTHLHSAAYPNRYSSSPTGLRQTLHPKTCDTSYGYRGLSTRPRGGRISNSTSPTPPAGASSSSPGVGGAKTQGAVSNARHEAQERNLDINIPFNPPGGGGGPNVGGTMQLTGNPLVDAALTTFIGLGLVFFGGVLYVKWYKKNVLDKIELAFAKGYDPALELATHREKYEAASTTAPKPPSSEGGADQDGVFDELDLESEPGIWAEHLRRREQDWIDRIIHGQESGHYFVLLGPKGSGKTTMVFESMKAVQAEGVAMCDAHPDLEVFRMRLGVALNYEFNEDTQTGLFQRRDPREAGPQLDIERALNKLEKVALRSAAKTGRPLVLVLNNIHFFNNDEAGRNMLLQLQQRAESWAASGILTMIFSSDDFWPFNLMRQRGSRMLVVSITDLEKQEAIRATARMRKDSRAAKTGATHTSEDIKSVVDLVGGRLSFLNKVTKSREMAEMAKHLLAVEKANLLSKIGLIQDCDDDVMDEQKWASCSWLLLQEFVKMRQEQEKEIEEAVAKGLISENDMQELPMPAIPYWKCRQLMTRADFLEELDRQNIIAVDVHHDVRPDSMLILHAARQVVEEDGFDDKLESVRDRIDEIESLHRTRELTFKDLGKGDRVFLVVDKDGDGENRI